MAGGKTTSKPFWPRAPVTITLGVILAVAAWLTYSSLARARDAADASCLASLHAALNGAAIPDAGQNTSSWRTWSPDQVNRTLSNLQGYGDCDMAQGARWRSSLQIRSRQVGQTAELQLWLRGRPHVSSPWSVEGLE
jgi:hypothetical protein